MKNLLEEFFKTSNMKKLDFALRVGVNRSVVYRWLNYLHLPHPDHAKKIQTVTKGKVPVSYWGYVKTTNGVLVRISKYPIQPKDFTPDLSNEEDI